MSFIKRSNCPACGQINLELIVSTPYSSPVLAKEVVAKLRNDISAEDFQKAPYEIYECKNCHLLFQRFVPDEDFISKMYKDERNRETSLSIKLSATIDIFIRDALLAEMAPILLMTKPQDVRLLDFGSGWGQFLKMASAHGMNVAGVEVIAERVAYARENGLRIVSSLDELHETFNFIHTDQTLEHINEPFEYVKKLSDHLVKGGIIYVGVPNASGAKSALKKTGMIVKDLYPLQHVNGFNNSSLKAICLRADLVPLKSWEMSKLLARNAKLSRNGQFFQEALKVFYKQNFSTGVYFRKV